MAPAGLCAAGQRHIGPRQGGRRMGARDGRCGAGGRDRDGVDSGGHQARKVPQGGKDDTGGHKVHIPHGTQGAWQQSNGEDKRSTYSSLMTD